MVSASQAFQDRFVIGAPLLFTPFAAFAFIPTFWLFSKLSPDFLAFDYFYPFDLSFDATSCYFFANFGHQDCSSCKGSFQQFAFLAEQGEVTLV